MTLSETWFVEGSIDFELQKYRLLAYLQEVQKYFGESKLYPQLSDVIFHYNNLLSFSRNKRFLQDHFPQAVEGIDGEKLELIYEKMLADDAVMQELEDITGYAAGHFKKTIDEGTGIYDYVEENMQIEPVGIMPLYKNEGYLLLQYGGIREVRAYRYTSTLFEKETSRYRALKLQYLHSFPVTIINTREQIKRMLIQQSPDLPQPAVYLALTPLHFPLDETILPVAKRRLMRYLTQQAA